jgi:phenylalanyl-tRNA synthetase beta chain
MEYSLHYLNKLSNLKNLKLTEIIETLNLIGFEVDDIYQEKLEINSLITNIRFLLKIPANREDLLIEELFLKELCRLFSLENISKWKLLQKYYFFLLKKHYYSHQKYQSFEIKSSIKDILIYNIQIKTSDNFISPKWIQKKLINNGLQFTNDLNDLVNLISFEWGQTIQLSLNSNFSSSFFVEKLKCEEVFLPNQNLQKEILLPKNSIVLKNNLNQIESCLGYISPLSINNITNKVINIQAIFYDIHLNSLNISLLNSKLSARYLRKTFLEFFRISIQRFLTLFELLTNSNEIKIIKYKTISNSDKLEPTKILKLKKSSLVNFLNIKNYNESIFKKTGLQIICKTRNDLYFEIPNTRKDLTREIDLIEECSRFIGYKNFTEIIPKKILNNNNLIKKNKYKFLKQFFINLGFNEVLHSSIEENKKESKNSILLNNPLNNDFFLLRTELSKKIFQTFENNERLGFLNNNFFEIGRIFKKINNNFIEEERFVAIFEPLFGKNETLFSFDWYVNKGFVENLLKIYGHNEIYFEKIKNQNTIYHPTRSCLIKSEDRILGIFGEINPFFANTKKTVFLIELNLSEFKDLQLLSKIQFSKEISKYPSITKDLSFLIEKSTNFIELQNSLKNITENLKNFYFFDIYFQNSISTKINIGIRFEFQSNIETLTNLKIEKEIEIITNFLQKKFEIIFTK